MEIALRPYWDTDRPLAAKAAARTLTAGPGRFGRRGAAVADAQRLRPVGLEMAAGQTRADHFKSVKKLQLRRHVEELIEAVGDEDLPLVGAFLAALVEREQARSTASEE